MPNHAKYIELAFKMAVDLATGPDTRKLAAIVVKRGIILGIGGNTYSKSHPFAARFKKNPHAIYPHAETMAIYNSLKRRKLHEVEGATLYVSRCKFIKQGKELVPQYGLAKPCIGCMSAISTFKFNSLVYSVETSEAFEAVEL